MSVAAAGAWEEDKWHWNMEKIIRNEGEENNHLAEQLLELLNEIEPEENDGAFTVNSCYKAFAKKETSHWITTNMKESLASLWKVRAPTNILLFGWRLILNRLPTEDKLTARGIEIEETKKGCELCRTSTETRYHLFFECSFSHRIWDAVFNWMDSPHWITEKDFEDYPNSFKKVGRKETREMMYMIWLAVVRTLWHTRNAAIFEEEVVNFEDCLSSIKLVSWKWINSGRISISNCCSYYEWYIAPLLTFL
ncbi:uncharacterized protein LOC131640988 [Vicia villosa]|uniref:uncharacterized protein LOC131640988 n=1 Tax=Vicia villosa TaxID=3911 RepID=UPI00273AD288|nr:uncharacterized protein LOC131640988 [Vicia villosa]